DGGGRCHDHRGEQVPDLHVRDLDVCRHDGAGHVGHAAGHDAEQLGLRHARDKRADGERGLGLTHEDAGGHIRRLSSTRAHDLLHDDGHGTDHHLHYAKLVENREQRCDEDDDGQYLEGEQNSIGSTLGTEGAEQKLTSCLSVLEQRIYGGGRKLKDATEVRLEHDEGECELEAEPPEQYSRLDGAFVW